MHKFTIFTVLSVLYFSVPVVPLPFDQPLDKRSYTGEATWFNAGLGACGYQDTDQNSIIALSTAQYQSGAHCNKGVTITNTANGHTASGTVRDECPGCGVNDLDLSVALFEQLGDLDTGKLSITWAFQA